MRILEWLTIVGAFLAAWYLYPTSLAADSPPPTEDIDAVVENAVEQCKRANAEANFGIASVADWCEIRAWSVLGQQYPSLAARLGEAQRASNEKVGRINELREQLDQKSGRIEVLSARLGQKQAALNRSIPVWQTVLYVAGGVVAGGLIVYGAERLE